MIHIECHLLTLVSSAVFSSSNGISRPESPSFQSRSDAKKLFGTQRSIAMHSRFRLAPIKKGRETTRPFRRAICAILCMLACYEVTHIY